MVDVPAVDLEREEEPNDVRNAELMILAVSAITQFIMNILGVHYVYLHFYEFRHEVKCYPFEDLELCQPNIFSFDMLALSMVDSIVFSLFPGLFLIVLLITIWQHRWPPRRKYVFDIVHPMYPTLIPTIYYYLVLVSWSCSAVDNPLKFHSPWLFWMRIAWTSIAMVCMGYAVLAVAITIRVCRFLQLETIEYARVRGELEEEVEGQLAVGDAGQEKNKFCVLFVFCGSRKVRSLC